MRWFLIPRRFRSSSCQYRKTEVTIIFNTLRMVMKHPGHLTSLKYPQRIIHWKEELQRTISTLKSCKIYTKHMKKFTTHDRFWKSSHLTISRIHWTSEGCLLYFEKYTFIGHWACVPQSLSMASQDGMKMAIKKRKNISTLRRTHTACYVRFHPFSQRPNGDEKSSVELFFLFTWLSLKIEKRKMDQMNAGKCRSLFLSMTEIGACFSVARSIKRTEKRLAHVRKWCP